MEVHNPMTKPVSRIVPLSQVRRSPPVHKTLPIDLLIRIGAIREVFKDIEGLSIDEWITDFRSDRHPERELRIWEKMASAMKRFEETRTLDREAKREVTSWLLALTMHSPDAAAKVQHWKVLREQDRETLRTYYEEAGAKGA
jgi:hypothetical protein